MKRFKSQIFSLKLTFDLKHSVCIAADKIFDLLILIDPISIFSCLLFFSLDANAFNLKEGWSNFLNPPEDSNTGLSFKMLSPETLNADAYYSILGESQGQSEEDQIRRLEYFKYFFGRRSYSKYSDLRNDLKSWITNGMEKNKLAKISLESAQSISASTSHKLSKKEIDQRTNIQELTYVIQDGEKQVGLISIRQDLYDKKGIDFAVLIDPSHAGNAYATKAANYFKEALKKNFDGQLYWERNPNNQISGKVADKLGFNSLGVVPERGYEHVHVFSTEGVTHKTNHFLREGPTESLVYDIMSNNNIMYNSDKAYASRVRNEIISKLSKSMKEDMAPAQLGEYKGISPFHAAILLKDYEIINAFLKKFPHLVNQTGYFGDMKFKNGNVYEENIHPLEYAMKHDHKLAKILLSNPNIKLDEQIISQYPFLKDRPSLDEKRTPASASHQALKDFAQLHVANQQSYQPTTESVKSMAKSENKVISSPRIDFSDDDKVNLYHAFATSVGWNHDLIANNQIAYLESLDKIGHGYSVDDRRFSMSGPELNLRLWAQYSTILKSQPEAKIVDFDNFKNQEPSVAGSFDKQEVGVATKPKKTLFLGTSTSDNNYHKIAELVKSVVESESKSLKSKGGIDSIERKFLIPISIAHTQELSHAETLVIKVKYNPSTKKHETQIDLTNSKLSSDDILNQNEHKFLSHLANEFASTNSSNWEVPEIKIDHSYVQDDTNTCAIRVIQSIVQEARTGNRYSSEAFISASDANNSQLREIVEALKRIQGEKSSSVAIKNVNYQGLNCSPEYLNVSPFSNKLRHDLINVADKEEN